MEKLFHWRNDAFDLLIMSDSELEAKDVLQAHVNGHSNPGVRASLIDLLSKPPQFIAPKNYPVVVWRVKRLPLTA